MSSADTLKDAIEPAILERAQKLSGALWNRDGIGYVSRIVGDKASRPSPIKVSAEERLALIVAHLTGQRAGVVEIYDHGDKTKDFAPAPICLGALALDAHSRGLWACIDIDGGKHTYALSSPGGAARAIADRARAVGLFPMIERSRSGSGFHVWIFVLEPMPGADLRELGLRLCPANPPELATPDKAGQTHADAERNQGLEVFPKQSDINADGGGYGAQVWFPLWHGAKDGGGRFVEIGADGEIEEIDLGELEIERNIVADVEAALDRLREQEPERMPRTHPDEDDPSGREKVESMPGAARTWFEQVKAGGLDPIVRGGKLKTKRIKDQLDWIERCPACGAAQRSSTETRGAVGVFDSNRKWKHHGTRPDGSFCGAGGDAIAWAAFVAVGVYPGKGDPRWAAVKAWCFERMLFTEQARGSGRAGGQHDTDGEHDAFFNPGKRARSGDWEDGLPWVFDRGLQKVVVASRVSALRLILKNDPELDGIIAHNGLLGGPMMTRRAPFLTPGIKDPQEGYPRPWTNTDDTLLTSWLEVGRFGMTPSKDVRRQALASVAAEHAYHPVQDWLESLKWDGQRRIDTWLIDAMGAKDSEYVRAVSRKWLISGVARAMRPGSKADHCLVLMGAQGLGKSTLLTLLARNFEWFTDALRNFDGPKALEALFGRWIVELGELEAMGKSDIESTKAFLTKLSDDYRTPFAERKERHLRQAIFAATTNKQRFLQDATGNRRFWPVLLTKKLDRGSFQEIVPMLWAEAREAYQAGEAWHLDEAMEAQAELAQEGAFDVDEWENAIRAILEERAMTRATVAEIVFRAAGKTTGEITQGEKNRIGRIMGRLGWVYRRSRPLSGEQAVVAVVRAPDGRGVEWRHAGEGARVYFWEKPTPTPSQDPDMGQRGTEDKRRTTETEHSSALSYDCPMSHEKIENSANTESCEGEATPPPPDDGVPPPRASSPVSHSENTRANVGHGTTPMETGFQRDTLVPRLGLSHVSTSPEAATHPDGGNASPVGGAGAASAPPPKPARRRELI